MYSFHVLDLDSNHTVPLSHLSHPDFNFLATPCVWKLVVEINYICTDFIGDSITKITSNKGRGPKMSSFNKVQAKVVYFYYKTIFDVLSNVQWFCLFSNLILRLYCTTMLVEWNSRHWFLYNILS